MPDYEYFEVPLQGLLRYTKSEKSGEYIQLNMVNGSIAIIKPGKDGFFDENFNELRKYAVDMKRLLDYLKERANKNEGNKPG